MTQRIYRGQTSKHAVPEPLNKIRPEISEKAIKTSSFLPVMAPEQELLYRDVLLSLEEHHVPYAVAGAFALREYTGICRMTKDLDIFLPPEAAGSALHVLRAAGFECEITDPVWLAKAHRNDFFVDLITGMSNATLVVDQCWIKRARPAHIVGVNTRVLAPEELLASKLFVIRRERFDGADIAHIIYGTQGKLQWDRVLQLTGAHWEILLWMLLFFRYNYPAQTSYIPHWLWHDLLQRLNEAVEHPEIDAPFRGSLVDDYMFAIDVNEWKMADLLQQYRSQAPKIEATRRL